MASDRAADVGLEDFETAVALAALRELQAFKVLEGEKRERAAICAWLRSRSDSQVMDRQYVFRALAAEIEMGVHMSLQVETGP